VRGFFVLAGVVLSGTTLLGQTTPPLVTDRPNQTESAFVVPDGRFQIETGAIFESNLWRHAEFEPERRALHFATTLVRFGLGGWAELRLASAYRAESTRYRNYRVQLHGLEAVSVGTKVAFWAENGLAPQVVFTLSLDLPVGAEAFRPDAPEPTAVFAFAHTLSARWTLGYNLGATWPSTAGRVLHYTAALGYSLSRRAAAFLELYGDDGLAQPATLLFDTGLTLLLRRTLQLDFATGFALAQDLPGWFVSTGFSVRLPD